MSLLIQNATAFVNGQLQKADILINDSGIIEHIGSGIAPHSAQVLDASDLTVVPAFTDLHVHLREPGFTDKETIATGTLSAAAGGFTTIGSMPNLNPVPDSLAHLQPQLDAIQKDALVRVHPYGSLTAGQKGEALADIAALAPFVCGFTDDGRGVQDDELMRSAMRQVAQAGSFIAAHCEDESLIPAGSTTVQENCTFANQHGYKGVSNQSEWAEVERDIRFAEETGCHLHICHTSTAKSFQLIRQAKAKGLPVTCEVTPHNLILSCDDITEDDGRFKMNPPLRTIADKEAAIAALLDGTVDAIATDHAPHTTGQKSGGFAKAMNGVIGFETAFAAMYTHFVLPGLLTLPQLLLLMNDNPKKILKEEPATIAVKHPANLTLLNLTQTKIVDPTTFCTKGRSSPFTGATLTGWPAATVLGSNIVWQAK